MAVSKDQPARGVNMVEQGIEKLTIAAQGTPGEHGENTAMDTDEQSMEPADIKKPTIDSCITVVDIDPLSADLAKAILRLCSLVEDQETPELSRSLLQKLHTWAGAPSKESVPQVLDTISALLLAEGASLGTVELGQGVEWTDGGFTILVAMVFRPILVDLVARWTLPEAPVSVFHQVSTHMDKQQAQLCVAYAAGILLATTPQVKSLVMAYFQNSTAAGILDHAAASQNNGVIEQSLVVVFRLVRRLPEVINGIDSWDWATPLTALMAPAYSPTIRLLACECLCLVSSYSDHGRAELLAKLSLDSDFVARILTQLVYGEGQFDRAAANDMVSHNKANLDLGLWQAMPSTEHRWIDDSALSSCVANVGGVFLHSQESAKLTTDLVLTPTVTQNIHGMALATSRGEPVLLQGPIGSGKTSLVEWVAKRTGNELVTIHLSSNMDAKVLLGNYVTTQKAGDFEWRSGLLTTAVSEGKWILIEDIDLAPSDVIQTLVPLLESRTLFVANRGENIPAHIQFRLFATLSTHGRSSQRAGMDGLLGSSIWTRLEISSLDAEMPQIIQGVFPNLCEHAELLAQSFTQVANIISGQGNVSSTSRSAMTLSMSDLVKWCTRLNKFFDNDKFLLFHEAVDTFTMKESDYGKWRVLVHRIGSVFGISKQRVDLYIDQHNPGVTATGRTLKVGRATLEVDTSASMDRMPFADTHHSRCLLERIATCVQLAEPALLSGETGTGKTTVVQHLATLAGRSLAVFNLSQQSDSSDLLGGFRPVDISLLALRLRETFDALFGRTVSVRKNAAFLDKLRTAHGKKEWKRLVTMYKSAIKMARQVIDKAKEAAASGAEDESAPKKRQKLSAENVRQLDHEWTEFETSVEDFNGLKSARMVFSFVEGALVKAARTGGWILLDEINLATAETLACLGGLLQKEKYLLLAETGARIPCHPGFRLFACMNPSNDVGKRDLPPGLRSSFTEFFVHPPDNNNDDLMSIIRTHLPNNVPPMVCHRVIDFYRSAKKLAAEHKLVDGANQKPHYSLRTLTRSLTYARQNALAYSLKRALYDGLFMTFVTQLENTTQALLTAELNKVFSGDNMKQLLNQVPQARSSDAVLVQSFWLPTLDADKCEEDSSYVLTSSVVTKIKSLARAVMCGRYPVLIQGPTSAGKTSMVQYLARKTGHKFVRINNHEHTDLQEYLGSYTSVDGKLVFEEGLLVKALRHGHWLVLDELNLAPSDVLEALNRLLDDNRELVIPETQEVVRPHPHFMLFATQNPAGLYGGRKALSRAFRNRFVELHFDDIPEKELQQIIVDSCQVPPTHAKLLVDVYRNLTQVRAQTRIFEASHGFITLRDLFRWANRHATTKAELAEHGYMLIAERVRNDEEKTVVRRAIEKAFYSKGSEESSHANVHRGIDVDGLYSEKRLRDMPEFQMYEKLKGKSAIAWTKAMRRLFILTALCLRFHEPVLLVGETGCGKTTVCQMLAEAKSQLLHIVNCHQNTESSDILGGQRPVRNRNALISSAHAILAEVLGTQAMANQHHQIDTPELLKEFIEQWQASTPDAQQIIETHGSRLEEAYELMTRSQDLFAWHDGPLVQAMKQGDMFLMDELNLADDSVLERLNSVLEPSRTLVLAEQIGAAALVGADGFEFVATMNPGGDYGKRELSPALRNRFTELWAPTTTDVDDLAMILDKRLVGVPDAAACTKVILEFVRYLDRDLKVLQHPLSLRDYLFWAEFISKTHGLMDSRSSVVHGACLVLLDSVGTQGSIFNTTTRSPATIKAECVDKLREMVEWGVASGGYELGVVPARSLIADRGLDLMSMVTHTTDPQPSVGVAPFLVAEGSLESSSGGFALHAPTTFDNLVKILRAMQVGKPLLLEGSPGVGKTTLVSTLAKLAGHRLVRINLSDQTDLMDLFGTDLPVDDGFAWCDAPFLQALKQGDWVLLDEINLASQSVLEGLNSCLDHRGTVYISELDREFTLSPGFRLFAAQNPLGQGGGRKGLPRSFVNRFTQVYMDELTRDDLQIICDNIYRQHPSIERVLEFNWRMHSATMVKRLFGSSGAPWEFNLRDVSRFMELALTESPLEQSPKPVDEFIEMLYVHRMRTQQDRSHVVDLYNEVFGTKLTLSTPSLHITEQALQVGNAVLPRRAENARITRLRSLHSQLPYMESLMKCIEMRWMAIMVGPAGSGKTSLVRWLANATGNKLVEFSMNSGVDTSEILGGFEQVDMQRHLLALVRKIGKLVNLAVFASGYQDTEQLAHLCSVYHATRRCTRPRDLCALVEQISSSLVNIADESFMQLLGEIQQEMSEFAALEVAGKFEWVDGILVDALLNGHWLLIDRANLCSASVLDRLNGLLEPNGVLYVNEDPKRQDAIVPHANFRIIMAVDPQYGELSRAMRNRGIEICVLPAESSECRVDDQAMVARAIGVSSTLLSGDVAPQANLTGIVQYAMQLAERTQRGAVAVNEEAGADEMESLVSLVVDPVDSMVSVAAWQSELIRHGLNSSADTVFGQRMVLAAMSSMPPCNPTATASLRAIVGSSSDLVTSLLDSPITASAVAARQALATEAGIDMHLLEATPLYAQLNHSMFRVLQRHANGPAARWHQALTETLMFQRERLATTMKAQLVGESGMREVVLQRPNLDIAFVETVFALIDGCDELVAMWDSFIVDASAVESFVATDDGDLAKYVSLLRSLFVLKVRAEKLLAVERGTASELAVAFESMQAVLSQLASAPGPVGVLVERLLGVVKVLVLDASFSAKMWSLVHPTTLADEQSREIEQRLVVAAKTADPEQRSTITEALAMLYATTTRKDRHLVLAALVKFADSLAVDEPNATAVAPSTTHGSAAESSALSPVEIITDVSELTSWHAIADLAIVAGSLSNAMTAHEDLSHIVRRTNVSNKSSWALLFTRLNWALNEPQHSLLPLFSDIAYEWYQRLSDHIADKALTSTSVSRINLPVATTLTLQQAGQLDCAIGERETVAKESRQLLRALSRFRVRSKTPASELSVLLALVMQVACALKPAGTDRLSELSGSIIRALQTESSGVDQMLVEQWHAEITAAAAAPGIDAIVKPAADAMASALRGLQMELVYAAWIEVGICMLAVSLPKRPVDPAAKAQTRFDWLGEDHAVTEADLTAYRLVQRSMTGETALTAATLPISDRLSMIDSERSKIELVYRPKAPKALFAELWQEAQNLQANVLGRAKDIYAKLLDGGLTADGLKGILGAAQSLHGTLEQFEGRVRRQYFAAYRDVAQVWCTYVHHVKYGLMQLVELRKAAVNAAMVERAALVNSLYSQPITSQPASHSSNAVMQSALSQLKTLVYFSPDSNPIKVYGELVTTLLMRTTLGVQFRGHLSPADLEALDMVFRDAYEIHKRAVDEKRKRDIEASKLFKSKVTKEQTDEELMAEIFPGYEDIYDAEEDEVKDNYEDLSEEVVAAIAACHQYVMLRFSVLNGARDVQPKLIADAQQCAFRLTASLNKIRPDLLELQGPSTDETLRGANLLSLAAVASATTTGDVSGDAQTDGLRFLQVNNFYKDAKPSEAILLKPLVAGIVERTEQLLEEWPDHAVLQQIGHMSKQLLLVPVTAPLAKLLAGLEMLYQRAQDWQAYASRDVSIEQLADVARLIVRWRQAELNAWPHLLLSQELEFARRPNEWWFNLYSSLLGSELTDFAALVSAIDQFMQASPAGEFRGRLNMLHAFCSHRAALLAAQALQEHKSLTELKLSDSVYAPLANAIDYYSQYAPCIAEHLANAKKAVKKDLTQYVKISSWKDVNPAALKESALRTHRHLARCVRQWREALSQPIFQIIQISQTANIANAKVPTVQLVPLPLSDAGIEIAPAKALAVGSASVRPWSAPGLEIDERLALELAKFAPDNLAKVLELSPAHLQQLHRMMQRSDAFAGAVDGSGSSPDALEEFALQVVGDINHFQNVETPKHLTKKPVTGKSTEPSSASKKNKLIIKSKKQKQEEEEEEYIEDDEERQRKIVQFWGEQRNLRRTRLKEILKALAGLGLKRNFRPASTTDDDNAGSHGLSTVLKQSPLDVSAWTESVRALATSNTDGVHGDSARAQRQWQLANAAFFRLSSQLAQLRTVMHEEHSAEINAQQVLHISGLMESLNQQVVRDRRAAADLVGLATDWLHLASVWANEPAAGTSSGEPCGDVAEVKRAVDELACLLTQCVVGVRKVSSAEGWERDDATTVAQIANKFDDASVQVSRASDALAVALTAVVAPRLAGLADANVPGYLARFEQTASATQTARASIASVQSVLDFIAETGWDTMPMQSWLTPICACVSRLNNLLDFAVSQPSAAELLSSELASLTGQWATAVMNVWQQVHKAEQQFVAYGSETDMWGLRAKELVHRVEMMQGMSQALHLPKMLGLCRSLISLIATQPPCSYIHGVLRPWITQYSLLVQHVVCLYADFHKTLVQFALTATTVLTSVIVHGLGSNDIYDSEETDESMESGTGMGEGSTAGAKNVSDEIEGEDQVEGLQGEEPDDTNDAGKDEDAIEMENDFQGQLGDADLETDDDDSDKSDDEDDENQMDEQLGDVDPTDPTALDEKLWDDDQEEDKPEESKGDDSKVDSKAKQKKEESDIVAGDDNDDVTSDNDKDGEQAEDDGQGSDQEMSDGSDDGEGEGDESDDDLNDRVNNDTLDRMADVEDMGEQLEMPDDLDMDDDGEDEEGDDESDDGLEADMNDDLPEDEPIDLKDDPSKIDEDNAEDANKDESMEDAVDGADEVDQDQEANPDDEEAENNDDEVTAKDPDAEDQDEQETAGEEEGEDEEDEDGHENPIADKDDKDESGEHKPTDGMDSTMNMDGNEQADADTMAESENALSKPTDKDQQSKNQESSQSAMQQESFNQNADAQEQGAEDEQQKRQVQPEKSLADVIEKWERRLNIIMRQEEEEEDGNGDEAEPELDQNQERSEAEKQAAQEASEFEHIKEDEEHDKVALADADDTEHQPMDIDDLEDKEEKHADDDAQMQEEEQPEESAKQAANASVPSAQLQPNQQMPTEHEDDRSANSAQMQQSTVQEEEDSAAMADEEADQAMDEDSEEGAVEAEPVDVEKLRDELEALTAEWRNSESQDSERAMQLWQSYTRLTHDLSLMLTEQLRLILTPTQATQLKGDYRTGKRLNMKRIIPYIASEFRKDKIWLRRTKPARREYQVMVALDNSKSMAQNTRAVELAYETLALVTTALNQLEVGQLSVVSFGENVSLLHPFEQPFDSEAGARVLSRFSFAHDKTDVVQLMDASLKLFEDAMMGGGADLWRLQLVISDGVCQDHPQLLRQVRAAMEQRIMTVFIVLDRSAIAVEGQNVDPEKDSIMNTQHVSFVQGESGKMEMKVERYLDTFPFKYYVVLRNINGLPSVLAETLRQYFSLVGSE